MGVWIGEKKKKGIGYIQYTFQFFLSIDKFQDKEGGCVTQWILNHLLEMNSFAQTRQIQVLRCGRVERGKWEGKSSNFITRNLFLHRNKDTFRDVHRHSSM